MSRITTALWAKTTSTVLSTLTSWLGGAMVVKVSPLPLRHQGQLHSVPFFLQGLPGRPAAAARLGDSPGDGRGHPLVEDRGNHVVLSKAPLGDDIRYRAGGGELHLLGDLTRPDVQ